MTMTQDEILLKMVELCRLQQQVDALKADLEPFLISGETFACEFGKLTKTKEVESFVPTAEGKRQIDVFKNKLLVDGLGKMSIGKPQLRLTLNKSANF